MKSQFITLSNFESLLDQSLLAKGYDYMENVEFKQILDQAMRPLRRNHGFIRHREFINAVRPIEALVESARQRFFGSLRPSPDQK